jgi:hypothetical protein
MVLAQTLPELPHTADKLKAVIKDLGVSAADVHFGADASIVCFAWHGSPLCIAAKSIEHDPESRRSVAQMRLPCAAASI